jgi:uncharacterized protein
MPDTSKEVLHQANAAIAIGDFEGFLEHCTDETEWTFVGERTLRGKAEVRQWMAETYREPPVFNVRHMIGDGDYVTAIGEISLKDDAGKVVRSAYCDVWRLRAGKLDRLLAFVVENGALPEG